MSSYKTILKTTGLFASLRVLSILINVLISKFIALIVGSAGIGLYGIFSNTLVMLSTIADLGVSKSSIRNIAQIAGENNDLKLQKTVSLVNKLILVIGSVGGIITVASSYFLSVWTFGHSNYWFSFVLIGISVFFTTLKEGSSSIFQGLRKYKIMAGNTIKISIISFFISIPIIYYLLEEGIIYSLFLTAVVGAFVNKLSLKKLPFKIKSVKLEKEKSFDLIKLGLSMMLVSFLVSLSGYIIRTYISKSSSLEIVGYFQAGFQIISGYFGIIFTSMSTDYFPRISAICNDNKKLSEEVNQQAIVSLLLICPLIVLLPFLMPFVISFLYTNNFTETVSYVNVALFGIIFQAGSQTMGMILLAKNNSKVFLVSVFLFQTIFLVLNILGFKLYGLFGLGVTFAINMLIHLIGVQIINFNLYKIRFNKLFFNTLSVVLLLAVLSFFGKDLSEILRWVVCVILFCISLVYTVFNLKRLLGIKSIKDLIKRKRNEK